MKHTWGKNNKTVKEYWKQVWNITKMAAGVVEKFLWLSKTFCGSFLRAVYPSRVQVKFKGKQQQQQQEKKPVFIVFLGLKDFGGFKDRQERVTRKHWPPVRGPASTDLVPGLLCGPVHGRRIRNLTYRLFVLFFVIVTSFTVVMKGGPVYYEKDR